MHSAKAYYANCSGESPASMYVARYAPLVKKIALHLKARLPQSVQLDDLIQSGMEGLLDAANNFTEGKGATFETFAGIRIRGAMIDEMRRGDWVPRSVHRNTRLITDAMSQVSQEKGRDGTDVEIAQHLGVSVAEYHTMLYDASSSRIMSIEDLGVSNDVIVCENQDVTEDAPLNTVVREKYHAALTKAIDNLPEREKLVFSLYYQEELNLKEIGSVLEVSESRVSQILNQGIMRLRSKLRDWL
ncbi:MAG: RNA polymerase sigma factor FliA [Succinivibrionaceae bacterium]